VLKRGRERSFLREKEEKEREFSRRGGEGEEGEENIVLLAGFGRKNNIGKEWFFPPTGSGRKDWSN